MSVLKRYTGSAWESLGGTASAVWGSITGNLSSQTDLQTSLNSKAVSNPNLLDNPWFTVNQRGTTTYTVGEYGVDRWKLVSGTATVSNNQITLNGTLRQIRENTLERNDFIASVICASGTAIASYDDSTKCFDIVSSGGVIKCAKLEIGTASTLALDTVPNYAEELLKCQRYFYSIPAETNGFGVCHSTNNLWSQPFNFPTQMRATPTASAISMDYFYNGSFTTISVNPTCTSIGYRLTFSISGFTAYQATVIKFSAGTFSADL